MATCVDTLHLLHSSSHPKKKSKKRKKESTKVESDEEQLITCTPDTNSTLATTPSSLPAPSKKGKKRKKENEGFTQSSKVESDINEEQLPNEADTNSTTPSSLPAPPKKSKKRKKENEGLTQSSKVESDINGEQPKEEDCTPDTNSTTPSSLPAPSKKSKKRKKENEESTQSSKVACVESDVDKEQLDLSQESQGEEDQLNTCTPDTNSTPSSLPAASKKSKKKALISSQKNSFCRIDEDIEVDMRLLDNSFEAKVKTYYINDLFDVTNRKEQKVHGERKQIKTSNIPKVIHLHIWK